MEVETCTLMTSDMVPVGYVTGRESGCSGLADAHTQCSRNEQIRQKGANQQNRGDNVQGAEEFEEKGFTQIGIFGPM